MNATDIGYDAGAWWVSQEEPEKAVQWRKAFAAYVQGMSLREISEAVSLDYDSLRRKSTDDDWSSARQQLVMTRVEHRVDLVDKVEQQIARIKANRETNLEAVAKLRDHAVEIIGQLQAGTLKVQKPFNTKLGPILMDMNPSTSDMVNIARYLQIIADLGYRALGDAPADSKTAAANASASTTGAPPGITVILPSVAVNPRPRRAQKARAEVIDIQAEATEPEAPVANPPLDTPAGTGEAAST